MITIKHIAIFTVCFAIAVFAPPMIFVSCNPQEGKQTESFFNAHEINLSNKIIGKEIKSVYTSEVGREIVINFTDNSTVTIKSYKYPMNVTEHNG